MKVAEREGVVNERSMKMDDSDENLDENGKFPCRHHWTSTRTRTNSRVLEGFSGHGRSLPMVGVPNEYQLMKSSVASKEKSFGTAPVVATDKPDWRLRRTPG